MRRRDNRAWIVGDVAYVDVTTSAYPRAIALVDAWDLNIVLDGRGRWRACRPRGSKTFYVWRWVGPRTARQYVFLHRDALGLSQGDGVLVDHVNRDGLDNRRANLREATATQNNVNAVRRPGLSRFIGVRPTPGGRWQAQIRIAGIQRYLGSFDIEKDAARAYDDAARDTHGSFALTNFAAREDVAA